MNFLKKLFIIVGVLFIVALEGYAQKDPSKMPGVQFVDRKSNCHFGPFEESIDNVPDRVAWIV